MKNLNEYSEMDSVSKAKKAEERAIRHLYIVMIFGVVCYYILPMLNMTYLKSAEAVYYYIFLYVNTVYCFISCYFHSVKNSMRLYVPVATGLLFVPSCMVFGYHHMAPMSILYLVLSFLGAFTGHMVYKRKKSGNKTLLTKFVSKLMKKKERHGN